MKICAKCISLFQVLVEIYLAEGSRSFHSNKVLLATVIEIWKNSLQTRHFCYIRKGHFKNNLKNITFLAPPTLFIQPTTKRNLLIFPSIQPDPSWLLIILFSDSTHKLKINTTQNWISHCFGGQATRWSCTTGDKIRIVL